jgi:hypothetical protein
VNWRLWYTTVGAISQSKRLSERLVERRIDVNALKPGQVVRVYRSARLRAEAELGAPHPSQPAVVTGMATALDVEVDLVEAPGEAPIPYIVPLDCCMVVVMPIQ